MESKQNKTSLFIQGQIGGFCWKQWVGEMDGWDQMVERTAITRARGQLI